MKEVEIITTSLRISSGLNERIKRKSIEIGASQNSMMMILLDLGLKIYDGKFIIQIQEE